MPNWKSLLLLAACAGSAAATPSAARAAELFPLKEGDTWVMAGDSITAQHLHSNYFEAFCFARYPKLTFRFRNSGVGGHTIPTTLARFDWDVAAWKPTVVSVELGMNDQGRYSVEQYIANMGQISDRIKAVGARPVFFTASPINNGETMAGLRANRRLHQYAVALKSFAAQQHAPFADQFHLLIDVWGKNKPREMVARSIDSLKAAARDEHLAGVEHLRAFLAAQEKSPHRLVSMQGDPVHPGPPGQLMMAAALLKELGADGQVSSAALEAAGKVTEVKGCKVENVKTEDGRLAFDRLDEALPFPIPDDARPVLPLYPTILDLSRYTLKVAGLADGDYLLKVNGQETARLTAKGLGEGVNLTAYGQGPIADQGKQILAAVAAKEGLVSQWRGLSHRATTNPELKDQLATLTKRVEAADAKIREAVRPRKLHFELVLMK
jgi:lysophospholipase L1-like esterase